MELNSVALGDAFELIDSLPKGRDYIIVTDPPFNIGYHYDEYSDRLSDEEYYIGLATLVSKAGGKAVVIHYPEALHRLSMELKTPPHEFALGSTIPIRLGNIGI